MKLLLALLLVGACSSCTINLAGDHRDDFGRTIAQEVDATARITVLCPGQSLSVGSGVQVSDNYVVTAGHVVNCKDGIVPLIAVKFGKEPDRLAVVDTTLPQVDVARLALVIPRKTTPIRVGRRPEVGERVCESAAEPRWTYRCFTVDPDILADDFPPEAGVGSGTGPAAPADILLDGTIEHGNSGAGVYNDSGLLVGLSDASAMCEYTPCVGALAPLQGIPWIVQ